MLSSSYLPRHIETTAFSTLTRSNCEVYFWERETACLSDPLYLHADHSLDATPTIELETPLGTATFWLETRADGTQFLYGEW